jgi:RNA polymerase sigma factor (sigma-70 family)
MSWEYTSFTVWGEQLTREREALLVRRAVANDRRARDDLVTACLPAIAGMARHYRGSTTIARDELMQAGVLGLLRGLQRYDPGRGTPFWAYASWWVRQAMQQLVAELAYPVVLSDRALRELAALHRAQHTHALAHHSDASPRELAHDCDLSQDHVVRLLAVDCVPGRAGAEPGDDADDPFERADLRLTGEQLRGLPGGLVEREREVLRSRFGLGRPSRTLDEIAVTLGVSGERVRQIEACALEKLRDFALTRPTKPARRRPGTSAATPARSVAPAQR